MERKVIRVPVISFQDVGWQYTFIGEKGPDGQAPDEQVNHQDDPDTDPHQRKRPGIECIGVFKASEYVCDQFRKIGITH